jgi:hypothetical protein
MNSIALLSRFVKDHINQPAFVVRQLVGSTAGRRSTGPETAGRGRMREHGLLIVYRNGSSNYHLANISLHFLLLALACFLCESILFP